MSIDKLIKDKIDGNGRSDFKRNLSTTTSFARVIYWHYKQQKFGNATSVKLKNGEQPESRYGVTFAEKGLLESEIIQVSISKNINSPSGQFEILLLPSKNWKKFIAPGDWLLVYLFNKKADADEFSFENPNTKNLVMFGNVDRISRTKQRDEETDKVLTRYHVMGRDFGKIFEETSMWYDPFLLRPVALKTPNGLLTLTGIPFNGSPDQLVQVSLDVFIGKYGADLSTVSTTGGRTDPLEQWCIPAEIKSIFKNDDISSTSAAQSKVLNNNPIMSKVTDFKNAIDAALPDSWVGVTQFDEILDRSLIWKDLPGYKMQHFISSKSGSLWNHLKRSSHEIINDLYVELVRKDGKVSPAIVLRPKLNFSSFKDITGSPLKDHYISLHDMADIQPTEMPVDALASDSSFAMTEGEVLLGKGLPGFTPRTTPFSPFGITISQDDIKYENLGRDYESMSNLVWVTPSQSELNYWVDAHVYADSLATGDGVGLPMANIEMIKRFGLRLFEGVIEFAYDSRGGSRSLSVNLYRAFLNQIYDHQCENHLCETGTISTVGNPNAEIGRCLFIKPLNPSNKPKIYHVEGYNHNWSFPSQWETTWTLSAGQFNDRSLPFIDLDESDEGQSDIEFDQNYLVKTDVAR